MSQRMVVVGGGFAGLWAAASAARLRALKAADFEIALVSPDPFHVVRVRCYEDDIGDIRVPLDDVLAPIGVARRESRVEAIDVGNGALSLAGGETLPYGRVVLAPGSTLVRPPCPGAERMFDVDTYDGAERLRAHLGTLGGHPDHPGRWSAVIVGAGLVGLELACELGARLERARSASADAAAEPPVRVVLLDRATPIGAGMGQAAAPAIRAALEAAQVELRTGASLASLDEIGVVLSDGEAIPAATVIAATGMRASPLAASLPVAHDALGRVPVDAFLAVEGLAGLYAAGDVASARADDAGHRTVMSCQHARPMGRIAGYNAACDLIGCPEERVAFAAPDYVTVLDLGDWGAVYTSGWDRARVVAQGAEAKAVKRVINRERIYPPTNRDRAAILEAASPIIQARPSATS